MNAELEKLDLIEWVNDEIEYTEDAMNHALESLEDHVSESSANIDKRKGMLKYLEAALEKITTKHVCPCCNRSSKNDDEDDDEENVIINFISKNIEKMRKKLSEYDNNNDDAEEDSGKNQLNIFKNIKDSSWQPWKIQKNTITKLNADIIKYTASKNNANAKWSK
jgi:hypothetical protein